MLRFSLALALLLLSACAAEIKPLRLYTQAPQLTFYDAYGNTVALTDYSGKFILLHFWASWCAPCIVEFPNLIQFEKLLADKRVKLLAVALSDSYDNITSRLSLSRLKSGSILLDPRADSKSAFALSALPSTFLISPSGKVLPILDPATNTLEPRISGPRKWTDANYIARFRTNLNNDLSSAELP